jgi:hypothetical protein
MAGIVLLLIETSSNRLSANISIFSNNTYIEEEEILEPDNPEI